MTRLFDTYTNISQIAFIDAEIGMPAEDTIFYPEKTVEEVRKQLITDSFHPIMFCVSWCMKACVLYFVIFLNPFYIPPISKKAG